MSQPHQKIMSAHANTKISMQSLRGLSCFSSPRFRSLRAPLPQKPVLLTQKLFYFRGSAAVTIPRDGKRQENQKTPCRCCATNPESSNKGDYFVVLSRSNFIPGTLLSPGSPSGSISRRRPPRLPPRVFLFFSYFPSTAPITLSVFSCPLPERQRPSEVWQSDKPVTDFPSDCSQTRLSESVLSGGTARLQHQSPINILGGVYFRKDLERSAAPKSLPNQRRRHRRLL